MCVEINNKLNDNPQSYSLLSGSTGILLLLHNEKIICANVGDSRAGLVQIGAIEDPALLSMLSRDHTPQEPDERDRILNAGGKIMPCMGIF